MKPSKLYEALHALIGERVPLHIWGACGVGKSQIVAQWRAISESSSSTCAPCNSIRSIFAASAHCIGPDEWVPPKFLPTTGKGILFLDELTSAPQMTQAGCYSSSSTANLANTYSPMGGSSSPPQSGFGAWRALCDAAASPKSLCSSRT